MFAAPSAPTSKVSSTNVTFLPPELLAAVFSHFHCSKTLCALAVTSRALHCEAERELYRSLGVCGEQELIRATVALSTAIDEAGLGRTSTLVHHFSVSGSIRGVSCWSKLSTTLRILTNLQTLSITTSTLPPPFLLTKANIAGTNLCSLSVPFVPTRDLAALLADQRSITHLALTPMSSIASSSESIDGDEISIDEFISLITADMLPSLTSLRTPIPLLVIVLLPNRPIAHLWTCLSFVPSISLPASPHLPSSPLAQEPQSKTVPPNEPHRLGSEDGLLRQLPTHSLRTLHLALPPSLSTADAEIFPSFLACITSSFPHLTSLGIVPLSSILPSSSTPFAPSISFSTLSCDTPSPLSALRHLRTLLLPSTPSQFAVARLSRVIPSLRRVICAGFSRTVPYLCIPVNFGDEDGEDTWATGMSEEEVWRVVGAARERI